MWPRLLFVGDLQYLIVDPTIQAEALRKEGVERGAYPCQQSDALRFNQDGSGTEHPQPELAPESARLRIVEDKPSTVELQPQTEHLALPRPEVGGDDTVIERPARLAHVDPSREHGLAVCHFSGDSRRDDDPAEKSGQDLELIDPAEADERAGVGYDARSCHASSAVTSASHSSSVVR